MPDDTAINPPAVYTVEYLNGDGSWHHAGTTRAPDEWTRLMQQYSTPDGVEYRVRIGTAVVTTMRIRTASICTP